MGVTIYMIIYFFALSIHFMGSDLTGDILLYALIVPIVDFFVFTYDLVKGQFKWFSVLRSISFLFIGILNYFSFSYQELPYPTLFVSILLVSLFTFLYLVRSYLKTFKVRLIVYLVLIGFSGFNAWMSNVERLYFYTLSNPFYSTEINVERLYAFAYLYNQEGDKERTYYLLNKCNNKLSQDLKKVKSQPKEVAAIKEKEEIIQKSITLVMQNNWVNKEKL